MQIPQHKPQINFTGLFEAGNNWAKRNHQGGRRALLLATIKKLSVSISSKYRCSSCKKGADRYSYTCPHCKSYFNREINTNFSYKIFRVVSFISPVKIKMSRIVTLFDWQKIFTRKEYYFAGILFRTEILSNAKSRNEILKKVEPSLPPMPNAHEAISEQIKKI
jgi:hypothetical protein